MRANQKLRKSLDILDRLEVEIRYILASDHFGIGFEDFRRLFAGKKVKSRPVEGGTEYEGTTEGIRLYSVERFPKVTTEEVVLK